MLSVRARTLTEHRPALAGKSLIRWRRVLSQSGPPALGDVAPTYDGRRLTDPFLTVQQKTAPPNRPACVP